MSIVNDADGDRDGDEHRDWDGDGDQIFSKVQASSPYGTFPGVSPGRRVRGPAIVGDGHLIWVVRGRVCSGCFGVFFF